MKNYLIWVPALIVLNLISAKLSILNQSGNNKAAWGIWLIGIIPMWVIVSRFSKNLLFDAMLYDILLVLIYSAGIIYFGNKNLTIINYIGVGLAISGLFLVKL